MRQPNDGDAAGTAKRIVTAVVWDLPNSSDGLCFGHIDQALTDRDRASVVMARLDQFAAASIAELARIRHLDPLTCSRFSRSAVNGPISWQVM
jgi:hypothetical protein